MACYAKGKPVAGNIALAGLERLYPAVGSHHTRDLALLDDVYPSRAGLPGVAPGHRVVARHSSALLDESAADGKTAIQVDMGCVFPDLVTVQHFGINAVHPDCIGPAAVYLQFVHAVAYRQHAALAEHHVEIEFLSQVLEELEGVFVES